MHGARPPRPRPATDEPPALQANPPAYRRQRRNARGYRRSPFRARRKGGALQAAEEPLWPLIPRSPDLIGTTWNLALR